jgi:hypothetical protein
VSILSIFDFVFNAFRHFFLSECGTATILQRSSGV